MSDAPPRLASPALRLAAALGLSLVVAATLGWILLRPASRAPIPAVWEPRPAIADQIPGSPGPPAR